MSVHPFLNSSTYHLVDLLPRLLVLRLDAVPPTTWLSVSTPSATQRE
ncbi:hypothetical protein PC129_g4649 [Phytophthora cactorum]|uniref:Uncharacterized protein n=1 Tax=Phytophthora cactorum TaxID=29920 RepID=A0A329S199_9STRA|nr:hypothetical protein Pcac1_g7824 [Phytophthora cactorum]KAG2918438.1 hypothetical protein PC114_g6810 [Phytophthora cactorum]KAG2947635.1 hypothetical protein PC117_g6668 [Phytophthora cactorum]KAG3011017.1 hypothetical protein PC120_g14700 [Phytophthora cactorum]KAG3030298.1 hypothetical protein PC119_g6311 [Phytophthora cactorum]